MIAAARSPLALLRLTYVRYVGASAVALGVDCLLFLAALAAGAAPMIAAGAGYGAGIGAHWWLSSRAVFWDRLADRGRSRRRQQILFLLSAAGGLAITMAVVGLSTHFGLDPRLAKLAAIAVAFQATYCVRRRLVFA
ncbi:MAG: GtrA family protein [Sphingomonas bacterium]|nr:GtrA family protein [Sphingomonas bacterium]